MLRAILFLFALTFLASCGEQKNQTTPSPYPSVPMTIGTGDTVMPPAIPSGSVASGSSYSVQGTEPFWNVEVTPAKSILSRPNDTDVISTSYDTEQSDKGSIISIRGVKGDFFVTLTKGECSDGMSETKYSYAATVNVGAEELKGCANKK